MKGKAIYVGEPALCSSWGTIGGAHVQSLGGAGLGTGGTIDRSLPWPSLGSGTPAALSRRLSHHCCQCSGRRSASGIPLSRAVREWLREMMGLAKFRRGRNALYVRRRPCSNGCGQAPTELTRRESQSGSAEAAQHRIGVGHR